MLRAPLRKSRGYRIVLYSREYGFLSKEEVEAARKIIRKKTYKKSQLFIMALPYIPVTRKPREVRMGKGKGKISEYGAFARPGKPLFELRRDNVYPSVLDAFRSAQRKLSVRCGVMIL